MKGVISASTRGFLTNSAKQDMQAYQASWIELYLLGILVVGKIFTYWQTGLSMGYWEFFFGQSTICLAYICFTSCIAEMTSILPFSGGSYGYVRCVLGPLIGYMIGFYEAMEYIMFVTACLAYIGKIMTDVLNISRDFEPLYWLVFYICAVPIHMMGGRVFWKVGAFFALWILVLMIIYILGNTGNARMSSSTTNDNNGFQPEGASFMQYYPVGGWCFKGIEVMTLTCENISSPGRNVPYAMMASVVTMVVLVWSILLIAGSITPDVNGMIQSSFPMNGGLKHIFHLSDQWISLISMPTVIGTSFCFLYAGTHQLFAMASSGLFNPILKSTFGVNRVPYYAILSVVALSFSIEAILFYTMPHKYINVLFTLSMMSSIPVYVCLCISYLIYCGSFANLERNYRSPFGAYGAYYAMVIYGFAYVTLIGFPKEVTVSSSLFCGATGLALIYYFLVAKKRQFFSREEQKKFLKVYVVNANKGKHHHHHGHGSHSPRSPRLNLKHNAVAPSSGMTSPTDHPTPTEHSSHHSITRRQGWAGYLFGYLMRAQLDSDLLGSSGHPSSSSGGGDSSHGGGRSASGTALGEQKASEVRASREVS